MLLPAATKTEGIRKGSGSGAWGSGRNRKGKRSDWRVSGLGILPVPRAPLPVPLVVSCAALDLDADVACAADRALLVQPHFDPTHAELGHDQLRDAFRERLDQVELRFADEGEQALGDFLVVDRIFDPI